MSATGKTTARWPPGTEVIGKTSDYYAAGRLPDKLDFFEGEELTVVGSTGNRRSYEARRKRDGAIGVLTADDVVPELTKRPGNVSTSILTCTFSYSYTGTDMQLMIYNSIIMYTVPSHYRAQHGY